MIVWVERSGRHDVTGLGILTSGITLHTVLGTSQFPARPYRAEAATSCLLYYMDEMRMHNGSYIDSSSVS